MSNKTKITLAVVVTAVITAFVSVAATLTISSVVSYLPSRDEDTNFKRKLNLIELILQNKYLYDYDKEAIREKALETYIDGLDEPYTAYYSPEDFSEYIDNIEDGYTGIGIIVGIDNDNNIVVIAPFEGSPAYNAGILPGDILKAVNGTEYNGDSLSEAVDTIRGGERGTTVDIKITRDGTDMDLTVERDDISNESVKSEMIEDGIGYVRISAFNLDSEDGSHSTYSEFKKNVEQLQADGMKKMIIDLRDNPGGVLTEVCPIADMLLPEGTITYTEDKKGKRSYINSDAEYIDIPLVVLINGNSASASEVLTGALKDYGRAVIVGEKSFGKGIVQDVYTFSDGSGLSLTTSKYFTPNGICIHDIGIEPDETVLLPEKYRDQYASQVPHDDDTQLKRALEIIKEK